MFADNIAVGVKRCVEFLPSAKAHAFRQQSAVIGSVWQHVRLGIVQILQTVLQTSQKDVGVGECFNIVRTKLPAIFQSFEHQQRGADL